MNCIFLPAVIHEPDLAIVQAGGGGVIAWQIALGNLNTKSNMVPS